MSKHEFLCGGDYGAWECYVTVELTEEEETILREFASDDRNEHLDRFEPKGKIWKKVVKELKKQCEEELNMASLVIWIPSELRPDI